MILGEHHYGLSLPDTQQSNEIDLLGALLAKGLAEQVQREFLLHPLNHKEFQEIKRRWLRYAADYERATLYKHPRPVDYEGLVIQEWVLDSLGIVVKREMEELQDEIEAVISLPDPEYERKVSLLVDRISEYRPSPLGPESKVCGDVNEAEMEILRFVEEGYRVVGIFGYWDAHHQGHGWITGEAKWFGGLGTKTILIVASDAEATLFKGDRHDPRPIFSQKERVESLATDASVDLILPVQLPLEVDLGDKEGSKLRIIEFYSELHKRLPIHIRLQGETDEAVMEHILKQCRQAGILLVMSGMKKRHSTTELVRRIKGL